MSRGEMTTACSLELTRARVLGGTTRPTGAAESSSRMPQSGSTLAPARSGRFREADGPDRQQLAEATYLTAH